MSESQENQARRERLRKLALDVTLRDAKTGIKDRYEPGM
jgi:hypothetical protein